jgi:glycosyltransferase involved in cell wall biosynthesis
MDRLVSVVIPTFDRKDLTDRAVESVRPSCPELFEIIVVDDCGSSPYVYDKAEAPSGVRVRIFRLSSNQGPGLARKSGVEQSEGAIVAFLDSDDVFEPGWPDAIHAEVLRRAEELRSSLFITGRAWGASAAHRFCSALLGYMPEPFTRFCTRLLVIAFNPFYTPSTAMSKQLCSFWIRGRYCEDYFTNAMAILKAKRISVLRDHACTISRPPGSNGGLSESERKMWSGEYQVRKCILRNPEISMGYRVLVPLGMAYAFVRNVLKSSLKQIGIDRPNSKIQTDVPRSDKKLMRTVRVAILGTRGIPARYGGFETFAEELSAGLCDRGFDVTVFCESAGYKGSGTHRGIKLRYVPAPDFGSLKTVMYDLRCLWISRREFDIVYMLGYGAAPFCIIPQLFGTEVWINPDGLEWARTKWGKLAKLHLRLMEWASVRIADRIIADAQAIESSLESRHGELKACSVIPYGCEVVTAPPPSNPLTKWNVESDAYYLIVCRLEPENHVLEMLRAFRSSRSERKLIVVGNHASGTDYVKKLLSIHDQRIQMIGTVYDQHELTCLRYHAFAYLHGHSVGGTNPSLLEAMGCGNFILAHNNVFNRETLREAGTFFANTTELMTAIDHADANPSSRDALREAARSRARAYYSWPRIISAYAELMRS